ncbi:MAG: hypothetical protein GY941_23625 [Planctomycetes bacterium]|nr:hypothetical protein [Planctomycetota bacterium]
MKDILALFILALLMNVLVISILVLISITCNYTPMTRYELEGEETSNLSTTQFIIPPDPLIYDATFLIKPNDWVDTDRIKFIDNTKCNHE